MPTAMFWANTLDMTATLMMNIVRSPEMDDQERRDMLLEFDDIVGSSLRENQTQTQKLDKYLSAHLSLSQMANVLPKDVLHSRDKTAEIVERVASGVSPEQIIEELANEAKSD